MGIHKLTLAPNDTVRIAPEMPDGVVLEWCIDPKLQTVIVDRQPGCLVLKSDNDHVLGSGFYAVDVIRRSRATGSEIDREAYLVRVTMGNASGCVPGGAAPETVALDAAAPFLTIPSPTLEPLPLPPLSAPTPDAAEVFKDHFQTPDAEANTAPAIPASSDSMQDISPAVSGNSAPACATEPPLTPGTYELVLRRNGAVMPDTAIEIPATQTVSVGKDASCTLSLRHYFASDELARKCSRKQFEAFWSDGRVCIKNVGVNAVFMMLANPVKLQQGQWRFWPEQAVVELPCGLAVQLRKRHS